MSMEINYKGEYETGFCPYEVSLRAYHNMERTSGDNRIRFLEVNLTMPTNQEELEIYLAPKEALDFPDFLRYLADAVEMTLRPVTEDWNFEHKPVSTREAFPEMFDENGHRKRPTKSNTNR